MKVRSYSLAVVLAAFTIAAAPASAQSPREGGSPAGGGGERAGGGGAGNSGNAGGGGGGGGSVVSSGGGGGGSSSSSMSGASFSSPSGSAATASNLSFGDRSVRTEAPSRRTEFAGWASSSASNDGQRAPRGAAASGGGSGSGERAVPRGGNGGSNGADASGRDATTGNPGGRTRITTPSDSNANNSAGAREVPNWSRPRGDRPVTGTAVGRVGPPPDRDREDYRGGRYYSPYYYSPYYSYGYPGYYGYGYMYYPYTFGVGYGLYSGLGWNPYFADPYDPYYSGSGGYSSGIYNTREQGNLKLKVKPRNAKVYVDGFFVGLVDEFDGAFQKLALNSGRHKVEVRAEGYETAEFDVLISPEQTVTFQGDLKKIQ